MNTILSTFTSVVIMASEVYRVPGAVLGAFYTYHFSLLLEPPLEIVFRSILV